MICMYSLRTALILRKKAILCQVTSRTHSAIKKACPSIDYCVNLVRKLDHENYFCCLLLPFSIRTTAFAIRAFNIEISKIPEQVTETHLGHMRISFWDQCVDDIYQGKTVDHPVARQLFAATRRHKLSKQYLKRLIIARGAHMNSTCFKDMAEMERYADYTTSSIYFLLLEAFGIENTNCEQIASHLGKAQGISNLVRGLLKNVEQNVLFLPQNVLMKHGISEENIFRGHLGKQFSNIIEEIGYHASSHLQKARSLNSQLPKGAQSIFLPAVTTGIYLDNLKHANFNILDLHLRRKHTLLPYKLLWNWLICSY